MHQIHVWKEGKAPIDFNNCFQFAIFDSCDCNLVRLQAPIDVHDWF